MPVKEVIAEEAPIVESPPQENKITKTPKKNGQEEQEKVKPRSEKSEEKSKSNNEWKDIEADKRHSNSRGNSNSFPIGDYLSIFYTDRKDSKRPSSKEARPQDSYDRRDDKKEGKKDERRDERKEDRRSDSSKYRSKEGKHQKEEKPQKEERQKHKDNRNEKVYKSEKSEREHKKDQKYVFSYA